MNTETLAEILIFLVFTVRKKKQKKQQFYCMVQHVRWEHKWCALLQYLTSMLSCDKFWQQTNSQKHFLNCNFYARGRYYCHIGTQRKRLWNTNVLVNGKCVMYHLATVTNIITWSLHAYVCNILQLDRRLVFVHTFKIFNFLNQRAPEMVFPWDT